MLHETVDRILDKCRDMSRQLTKSEQGLYISKWYYVNYLVLVNLIKLYKLSTVEGMQRGLNGNP